MIRWNRFFFHSPCTYLLELVIILHDYVILFMISIIFLVLILILNSFNYFFSLNFYEAHELEFIWTIIPFIILFFILIPSLNSLYILDRCFFCGLTISIIGHQWYWRYFIKDIFFNCSFDSYMIRNCVIRLLEVDNRLVIPCFLPMRLLLSSSDVIHSWSVPSFGVKIDAIPGRLNHFCFSIKRTGVFFGQCSEICGANHRFIPIVLESVPFKEFISII